MFNKKIKKFFEGGPASFIGFIGILLLVLIFLSLLIDADQPPKILSHSEFINSVYQGNIKKIRISGDHVVGKFKNEEKFEGVIHLTDSLWSLLNEQSVDIVIAPSKQAFDPWSLLWIGFFILFLVGLYMLFKKNKGNSGGGSIFSFGKSKFKKVIPGEIKTTFADVAGATNAKSAMADIIDFLKDPERFKKLGARIPKGILLAGEPGNGKTLLARAVAGEARCTFLSISGSDFIEVFVGVGAARIRDLFKEARKNAPCILFIDEIDAIGRARGSGIGGGHDEREQTLNQLLTEMDGFDQYDQPLVLLAATNIPEVLDKALLRPGRFDRIVYVPYPDFTARVELFKVHSRQTPLEETVNFDELASFTQGLSGADIENLINLSALNASQAGRQKLAKADFEKAYKDLLNSKKDMQMSEHSVKEFLPQQVKTKFFDIAGLEDAKEDLVEIVDFLKNPDKYKNIGARIPKGVLMSGDPGNGKTLLARAVAGEAAVPFFYASGSQFIQKYVGVGAERIRELFREARRNAPSIIFIDELDAIGKRDTSGEGGDREYNQTINQLLTEMDGFVQSEIPVIVLAATNIKNAIDSALQRPGRFDRHIHVGYPNLRARIKILEVHAKGKKFDSDIQMETIARGTPGFSGAQLENLLNESAILTIHRNKELISMNEIEESKDRLMMGKENRGLMRNINELKKTAYHEAGHALLSVLQKDYPYAFHKVTILSRAGTLGVSYSLPYDDQTGFSKEQLIAKITVCMGGRAAEALAFGHVHTGAVSDFMNATNIAKDMVIKYGMGEKTGLVSYTEHTKYSTETAREIDMEIKKILDSSYLSAISILSEHREKLEILTSLLMEKETVEAFTVYDLAGVLIPAKETKIEDPSSNT